MTLSINPESLGTEATRATMANQSHLPLLALPASAPTSDTLEGSTLRRVRKIEKLQLLERYERKYPDGPDAAKGAKGEWKWRVLKGAKGTGCCGTDYYRRTLVWVMDDGQRGATFDGIVEFMPLDQLRRWERFKWYCNPWCCPFYLLIIAMILVILTAAEAI